MSHRTNNKTSAIVPAVPARGFGAPAGTSSFELPAGARSFQQAVDGKLTPEIWSDILQAQIEKAKGGDRGAAQFLIEYAGGVQSFRGATFVQENHYHGSGADGSDADPEAPPFVKRRGRPPRMSLNGDGARSGGANSATRDLGLRLLEQLSPTPVDNAALLSDLECTPEELEAAIDWLNDEQHIIVARTHVTVDGTRQPATALGPGQMPRVRKLLAENAAAAAAERGR